MSATDKRSWWKCLASCVIMCGYWTIIASYMQTHDPSWIAFVVMLVGLFLTVLGICQWNGVPQNFMKKSENKI